MGGRGYAVALLAICLERINSYLINLSSSRGPFLNNTMIRKLSNENLKKVLNNRRDQSLSFCY